MKRVRNFRPWQRLGLFVVTISIVATADSYAGLLRHSMASMMRSPGENSRQGTPGGRADRQTETQREQAAEVEGIKLRHRSEVINPYHVQFRDVTREAGIHFHHERATSAEKLYLETMGPGVAWIDYNNDGYLDAFFVNSGVTPFFHADPAPQPALYRNNRDGTFTDVTAQSKIHTDGTFFFGVAVADYDNDGFPDIYMTGYRHSVLWHNNGDGTFTDVTAKAGVGDDGAWGTAAGWFDYDHDGKLDLLVTNYVQYDADHPVLCGDNRPGYRAYCHPDSFHGSSAKLYHNNGDGTFTDVTAKAGVGDDGAWGTAAGWFDYDHDGKLDLLVTNYVQYDADHPVLCGDNRPGYRAYCHPDSFHGSSAKLYHNNGDGTFTDVTQKAGLTNTDGKSLAVVLADLDGDGWPDIFIANDTQRNFLYLNNGDGTFRDATYKSNAGFSEDGRPEAGMSADAADVMNNGLLYLFVSHLDFELNRLYRNNGDGTFTDFTIASGLGQTNILRSSFGARFFDFDNDGWRDLLVINGHILDNIPLYHPEVSYEEEKTLYRNMGEARFVDVTRTQDQDFRARHVGRGLAVGDYDNDGWQDFLVSNNGEDAQLFRNEGGSSPEANGNHWLAVKLIGVASNRDGIGAALRVKAGDFTSYDQMKGGMSYCSAQDPRIYFGLGKRDKVDSLVVRWPNGYVQEMKDIPADTFVVVTEGVGAKALKYPAPRPH